MNIEVRQPLNIEETGRHLRDPTKSRVLGHLISLNGMHGLIATDITVDSSNDQWSVGHLISIQHDGARLVGVVC